MFFKFYTRKKQYKNIQVIFFRLTFDEGHRGPEINL